MTRRHSTLVAMLVPLSLLLTHCNKEPTESNPIAPKPSASTAITLSEHRFKPAGKGPLKTLGQSCSSAGPDECASGICVHTGTARDTGYVCSQNCGQGSPCPQGWRCGRIHPSDPTATLCLPSETKPDASSP